MYLSSAARHTSLSTPTNMDRQESPLVHGTTEGLGWECDFKQIRLLIKQMLRLKMTLLMY